MEMNQRITQSEGVGTLFDLVEYQMTNCASLVINLTDTPDTSLSN
jgi:hypothetical protein